MGKRFTVGVLIGIVAGSIAGVLTAPKSGRETRDDIKRRAGELKGQVADAAYDAKDAALQTADDWKDTASGYAERGERAAREAVKGAKRGFFKGKDKEE